MTMERVALLDQLGFSWEVRPSLERPRATWQQRLEELTEFHNKTSESESASSHFLLDPSRMPHLHAWAQEQKYRLKLLERNNGKDVSKRMGPERVDALKQLGFDKNVELNDSEPFAVQVEEIGVAAAAKAAAVAVGTGTDEVSTTGKKAKQNKPIKDGDKKKAAKDAYTDQKKGDGQETATTATTTGKDDNNNNAKEGGIEQRNVKDNAAEAVAEEGGDDDKLYTTIEV
jgi:hypothetical protein